MFYCVYLHLTLIFKIFFSLNTSTFSVMVFYFMIQKDVLSQGKTKSTHIFFSFSFFFFFDITKFNLNLFPPSFLKMLASIFACVQMANFFLVAMKIFLNVRDLTSDIRNSAGGNRGRDSCGFHRSKFLA